MSDAWTIGFADATKRLDVFLSEKVGLSRTQAKHQVEAGAYAVNGKPVAGHHFLKEGDVVTSATKKVKGEGAKGRKDVSPFVLSSFRPYSPKDLKIIKETPSWLVAYKPAGVLMHPDHDHAEGTFIDAVIAHHPKVAKIGEDPTRPGIVSRLDKDVSGLVVIAKTQDAFDDLKRQFAEHSVTKEYIALVHGNIAHDEGDLKFRIARSSSKARMAGRPKGSVGGQAAWTHFDVVERLNGLTLLRLQILTGRTHQIRAHLHAFGHPVVGDPLYKLRLPRRKMIAPRVMLQSVTLAFDDPATKERVSFDAPLDPEFAQLISTL